VKILPLLTAYFLGGLTVFAQQKVASVMMLDLFKDNPETISFETEAKVRKESIEQDSRAKAAGDKMAEVEEMNKLGQKLVSEFQKKAAADKNGPEAEKIRALLEKRKIANDEYQSLNKKFLEFKNEKTREINKELARKMRAILNETSAMVAKYAAEKGYDVVYDLSGNTNTGMAVIIYAKHGLMTDITSEIQKMIEAKKNSAPVPALPQKPKP
jgi:Skp family chaperone for outer membrane proteins